MTSVRMQMWAVSQGGAQERVWAPSPARWLHGQAERELRSGCVAAASSLGPAQLNPLMSGSSPSALLAFAPRSWAGGGGRAHGATGGEA